jgi:hypothetical protein
MSVVFLTGTASAEEGKWSVSLAPSGNCPLNKYRREFSSPFLLAYGGGK